MRPLAFAVLALAAAAQAQDAASAIGGVLISPLLQRVQSRPAQAGFVTFALENPNQTVQFADLEIRAFTVEPDTYRTVYVDKHDRDCSAWFSGSNQQVTLAPGARQEVKLPYKVPGGANGVYWAMIRFSPRPSGSTTKSQVVYEIPVVVVVGRNARPVVEVGTPVIEDFPGQPVGNTVMVAVPIENNGDGFVPVGVAGTVKNLANGRTVADLHVEDRNLLPRTKRHLGFALPKLADGRYQVTMKVSLANRTLPAVTAQYVVTRGKFQLASAAAKVTQSPLVLEPASVTMAIPPGAQRRATFRITNNGKTPLTIGVKTMEIDQSPTGALEPVEPKGENGLEIGIAAETNRIEPGQTLVAQVEVQAPKTANGDMWFALQVVDATKPDSIAETLFGTVSIPGTAKPEVAVEDASLVKDGDRVVAVNFKVRNTGNTAIRPLGSASLLMDGVRLIDRLAVPVVGDGGLLPGKFVTNTVMMPAAPDPGSYVVELAYQYSDKGIAKLRVPVTVAGKPKPGKKQ